MEILLTIHGAFLLLFCLLGFYNGLWGELPRLSERRDEDSPGNPPIAG